ncbi:hypothetical protein [Streptomyces odontomachi]|uniref:hypothetical protein n=1 Tax=Streptomyces odontomachi TaxID=2944940 RepID=UPI00210E374F|nr:hypothetical protein [Streptomyces sp. ODS25]
MSIRHVRHLRRAGAATVLAAALAFTATACGGDDKPSDDSSSSSSQGGGGKGDGGHGATAEPSPSETIADVKGDAGIEMIVNSAKRDNGGFVTVSGQFKNPGANAFTIPIQWSGSETAVAGTGRSIAGMTLVDSKGKKRYYVLRDTDNRPLTTAGFDPSIMPNASLTFFAQFPAPPDSTTSVDLQFPGFPNTSIEIS